MKQLRHRCQNRFNQNFFFPPDFSLMTKPRGRHCSKYLINKTQHLKLKTWKINVLSITALRVDHLWNNKTSLREFKILTFETLACFKVDRTYPNIPYRKSAVFTKTERRYFIANFGSLLLVKNQVLWDIKLWILVSNYRRFGDIPVDRSCKSLKTKSVVLIKRQIILKSILY